MTYRLLEHTADCGIEVYAGDLAALFREAVLAMFDIITDRTLLSGGRRQVVHAEGDDWADLMINWLREALYLWNGRGLLVEEAAVLNVTAYKITAELTCARFDPVQHEIGSEIKAVTYHQIAVHPRKDGWTAQIIFDI